MLKTLKLYISIILILLAGSLAYGQLRPATGGGGQGMGGSRGQQSGEEDEYEPMKLKWEPLPKGIFIPSGIRVGADIGGMANSLIQPDINRYEFTADIDFHRFYLVADYGFGSFISKTDQIEYNNSGEYFKLGFDIDFLHKDPDLNMLYLGIRYAQSTVNDRLIFEREDPIFGDFLYDQGNDGTRLNWLEAVIGIKGQLYNNIYAGYSVRLAFRPRFSNIQNYRPYQMPGYGLGQFDTQILFNYYIYYRLPFREKVLIPLLKKK